MKALREIVPFTRPYRALIAVATMCMLLVTAANLIGPWLLRDLLATVVLSATDDANVARITTLALLVVSVFALRAAAKFGADYISHVAAWNMVRDIRQKMYDSLQFMSLRYYSDKQTGELMSRVINDTRTFEVLLAHAIPTVVVNVVTIIGVFTILSSLNSTLAWLALVPVPFLAWMVLNFSRLAQPLFRRHQETEGALNAILQDNFSGIREIKSFTQEAYESKRTGAALEVQTAAMLRALKLSNSFRPSIEFVASLGTVIVAYFGGHLALGGQLPVADLAAYFLYLSIFYQPIMALGEINEGLQQALGSADRVLSIIRADKEISDAPHAHKLAHAHGSLEFREVNFRYIDGIPVLRNISFKVKAGETLAIVGATGVGKSTIASLIPRFYDADDGAILVDGLDVREITLQSLRRQIGVVSQDVFLFNGTVRDNIVYGSPDAGPEQVVAAAKAANAHDFIVALEKGYDTKIGERGVRLSGGQKQRISIARAVLKNAPILILDEATSSVDTHTERLIQDALLKLKADKTAVIIAHRLSTVQDAHHIIVLHEGAIAEQGTHAELIALRGLYYRLSEAQTAS